MNNASDYAWHFCDGWKLRDGTPLEVGRTYHVKGRIQMCRHGLHWSERALDALRYAPGSVVCRVRYGGDVLRVSDKGCSSRRKVLWASDAEAVLKTFGRWCADRVLPLWDAPEVVQRFLATGDKSIRVAAGVAAWNVAMASPTAAAGRHAAAAAAAATGFATWAAIWESAWAATKAAVDVAKGAGAKASAREAVWEATRAAQNAELERRLTALKAAEPS